MIGDSLKVISTGLCDHLPLSQLVTKVLFQALQVSYQRLEDNQEDDGTVVITLSDSLEELEDLRDLLFGDYLAMELRVEAPDVFSLLFRYIEVLQAVLYQLVVNRPKSILKVNKGHMNSLLGRLCILNDLLNNLNMFNTTVDILEEGFLYGWINILILQHEISKLTTFNLMKYLAQD